MYYCTYREFVSVLQEMHNGWKDDAENKKLCVDVLKKLDWLSGYYEATELMHMMIKVEESMREHNIFS